MKRAIKFKKSYLGLLFISILFSCSNDTLTTGLEGTVYKGPINPIAIDGQSNDAPFSALFHIYNSENREIKSFSSNNQGKFKVLLAPGMYTIKLDSSTPIIGSESQTKNITINSIGMTHQDLYFDTGIR